MSTEISFPDIGLVPSYEGKPLFWQQAGVYEGLLPLSIAPLQAKPAVTFRGGKIPKALWQQIISFMLWSQEKFQSEAQARLFYHMDNQDWRVVVAPQLAQGLTTKELNDHPDRAAAYYAAEKDGYFCMGTVHHHCTISAFMSGTDENDERKQNGLHITLGRLDLPALEIHGRVSVRNVLYAPRWEDWFDFPQEELTVPVTGLHPTEWEARIVKPEPTHRVTQWEPHGGHGWWNEETGAAHTGSRFTREQQRWWRQHTSTSTPAAQTTPRAAEPESLGAAIETKEQDRETQILHMFRDTGHTILSSVWPTWREETEDAGELEAAFDSTMLTGIETYGASMLVDLAQLRDSADRLGVNLYEYLEVMESLYLALPDAVERLIQTAVPGVERHNIAKKLVSRAVDEAIQYEMNIRKFREDTPAVQE